jgi:hypothetical protein
MLALIFTSPPHALIGTLARLLVRKLTNRHTSLAGTDCTFQYQC